MRDLIRNKGDMHVNPTEEKKRTLASLCKENLGDAIKGNHFWRQLQKNYRIKHNDAVILVPKSCDEECRRLSIQLLSDFLEANHFKKAYILADCGNAKLVDYSQGLTCSATIINISGDQERRLLKYYNTSLRDERLVIAALDVPQGRILYLYTDSGCVTKREVFSMAVYNIPPCKKYSVDIRKSVSWKRIILRDLAGIPYIGLISFYYFSVINGMRKYIRLKEQFGDDTVLITCPHRGTGDVYNIGLYFEAYLRKNNIKKYTFLYRGRSEQRVGELFGINGQTILSDKDMIQISRFAQFIGPEKLDLIQLHHYLLPPQSHVHTEHLEGYHKLTFHETYKRITLGLGPTQEETLPRFEEDKFMSEQFEKMRLIPGKTVILSPYSTSACVIDMKEWEKLAGTLKEKGYTVATNCGTAVERAIKKTVELRVEYKYAKSYLEYAGYFVGTRSGFCDVVSTAKCKMYILSPYETPKNAWIGERGKTKKFYGIASNYGAVGGTVEEIEYTGGSLSALLDKLIL